MILRKISTRGFPALLLCFLLLVAGTVLAQDPRGTFTGVVTDSTGAVIPGVTVTAHNDATGVSISTTTNDVGNYAIPFLPIGTYTLTAESPGFKKYMRTGLRLRVTEVAEVNITLELGEVTETVEVSSEAPLLDTAGATLGQVIDEKRISELPLYAGNPLELIFTSPGMVNPNSTMPRQHAPWNNLRAESNGNSGRGNDFSIDGVPNTFPNQGGNGVRPAFSPPTTAVSEFRIETSPFDASVGHTIGASINVSTKSGTNNFHGGAHWYHKNNHLAAPSFFDNRYGAGQPVWQFNRYGADIGGPVILPKYNGRSKTFFFYTYEGNKWNIPEPHTDTVPTAPQRQGDFSGLLALGSEYQIYNPYSAQPAPNGRISREPFPGNIIPASLFDSAGQSLAQLYPMPNQPGTADGEDNYFTPAVSAEDYYVHMFRIDHVFNDANRIYFRFQYDNWVEDQLRRLGPNNPASGVYTKARNKGLALDYVRVINPMFVFNFRYGLTYQIRSDNRVSQGIDLTTLGFSSNLTKLIDQQFATIPYTRVDGYARISRFWDGDGYNTGLTHNFVASFTKMHGDHNIKFGASFRAYRANGNRFPFATSPFFRTRNTYTRGPLDSSGGSPIGQGMAALLLGLPSQGYMELEPSYAMNGPSLGLYVQDDWKVTPRLTLNLGLRWEYDLAVTERYNRLVDTFAATVSNPIEAQAQANYAQNPIPELPVEDFRVLGGLEWVGNRGSARTPFERDKANFMPRIGLAYKLSNSTVLRAGFGLFYDTVGVNRTLPIQTGYSQSTPVQVTLDGGETFVTTMSDPFPNGLLQPPGSSGGLTTNLDQSINYYRGRRKTPYSERWSFGLQQLLPENFLIEATYVGNRGTRLETSREMNATPAKWLSREFLRDQETIDFLDERFPNPFYGTDPIYGSTITRGDLLRPFPHFGSITFDDGVGYSWYHALQARVEKRFSQGITFQLAYTYSKLMEAVEFLNPSDPMPYESLSSTDRPQVWSLTTVWEMPFGRDHHFGANMSKALDALVGGWQFGAVWRYQSGSPLEFGDAIFIGNIKDIPLPSSERTVDRWFNTDAGFNRNRSEQRAGNLRGFPLRFGSVRGAPQNRWDLSLKKNFNITEALRVEFNVQAINALNHAIFRAPREDPTRSNFGHVTGVAWPGREFQLGLKIRF